MSSFLQLALALSVLIIAAKIGGLISYRLGQPSVLGELLAGIILGPSLLDFLHMPFFTDPHLPQVIHELAEIGVMLLMFLVGLELHLSDLAKSGKVSAFAGSLGVVFPMLLGAGLIFLFPLSPEEAIFIGLILSATSVSISAQTLMELDVLRSRVGVSLLGAAVFDDVLVVLGLSIFSALAITEGSAGLSQVLVVLVQMTLFLIIGAGLGFLFIPRLSQTVRGLPISQGLVAFALVSILVYGLAAEVFGNMAAITGAFLAGLLFGRSPVKERVESGITTIAYGFFVPIFFINVGLQANIKEIFGGSFGLFLVMTVLAIIGKVFGSGLGALAGGLNRDEALQLGVGMMSRGEVGLIVASVGITEGLINHDIFSAVVGVVIITTLLTPPLLRLSFSRSEPRKPEHNQNRSEKSMIPEGEGE